MSTSTTLTSLWVEDAGSPVKTVNIGVPAKIELKEEFERYFKENEGLGPLAKQAGILDTNGELVTAGTSGAVPTHTTIRPVQTLLQPKPSSGTHTYVYVSSGNTINGKPVVQQMVSTSAAAQRLVLANPGGGAGIPLDISRKRPLDSPSMFGAAAALEEESKRVRKAEKGSKGLRHFSMKVCEKVQRKGVTTYNEVADELVHEFTDPRYMQTEQAQYDQKNIRRRVYDALNVLMAMNIISKEKKEIRWIGLPTNSAQECQNLENERQRRLERIEHKQQQLQELVLQQIAYKNLVQRNKALENEFGTPPENSSIQLPFVIVNTDKKTVIDCSISNDKYEYLFNFDNTFEIHDDIEVLKRMGLTLGLESGQSSQEDINKAISLVPRSLERYVRDIARNASDKNQANSASHAPVAPNQVLETSTASVSSSQATSSRVI